MAYPLWLYRHGAREFHASKIMFASCLIEQLRSTDLVLLLLRSRRARPWWLEFLAASSDPNRSGSDGYQ
jgi:hypothetical protein